MPIISERGSAPLPATSPALAGKPGVYCEDCDIARAYGDGANSYIVKPVDFDKFLEVTSQIKLYWCLLNQPPSAHPPVVQGRSS